MPRRHAPARAGSQDTYEEQERQLAEQSAVRTRARSSIASPPARAGPVAACARECDPLRYRKLADPLGGSPTPWAAPTTPWTAPPTPRRSRPRVRRSPGGSRGCLGGRGSCPGGRGPRWLVEPLQEVGGGHSRTKFPALAFNQGVCAIRSRCSLARPARPPPPAARGSDGHVERVVGPRLVQLLGRRCPPGASWPCGVPCRESQRETHRAWGQFVGRQTL